MRFSFFSLLKYITVYCERNRHLKFGILNNVTLLYSGYVSFNFFFTETPLL